MGTSKNPQLNLGALVKKKPIKIFVGINSLTNTMYESYTNHIQTFYRFGRDYPHIQFGLVNPARMSIDRMRNLAAKTVVETEADYLLFIDDDVLVEGDGLQKLIDCNADIACGPVVIRGYPFDWMTFKGKGDGLFPMKTLPKTGIVPVDAVGFSFCLIKRELLLKIPTDAGKPYFVTGLNNTEDIYFCVRARQAVPDCSIVVECSQRCGHILWPEVMNADNREHYRRYWEKCNPEAVKQSKDADPRKKKQNDRGVNYLLAIKEMEENG